MNNTGQINNTGKMNISDIKDLNNKLLNGGKHLIAEFYACQCSDEIICKADEALPVMQDLIKQVGLTIVGEAVHQFLPQSQSDKNNDLSPNMQTSGYTISILLAESHICLHTWGELKTVTLDIYVCNFLQDNSDKADDLLQKCRALFQPMDDDIKTLWRKHNHQKQSSKESEDWRSKNE